MNYQEFKDFKIEVFKPIDTLIIDISYSDIHNQVYHLIVGQMAGINNVNIGHFDLVSFNEHDSPFFGGRPWWYVNNEQPAIN